MFLVVAALQDEVSGILKQGRFEPTPTPEEFLAYHGQMTDSPQALDLAIVLSGTGWVRAKRATRWAISHFEPEGIISTGFAGATTESLEPGNLVLATEVERLAGSPFQWVPGQVEESATPDPAIMSAARNAVELVGIDFAHGAVVTLPVIAKTSGMKEWIGSSIGAAAVDMECYEVARLAQREEIPFGAIRVIVDRCDEDLPDLVTRLAAGPAGGRIGRTIRHLITNPAEVPSIARLGRSAAAARLSLTRFFPQFISELTEMRQQNTRVAA